MPQVSFMNGRSSAACLTRCILGGAALLIAASIQASPALAQTYGSDSEGAWTKFMKSVGVAPSTSGANSDINYTERPPLVVPPTRDLPAPAATAAVPSADWPTGTARQVKHQKSKTEVLPDTAVQTPNPPYEQKAWYNPSGWFSKVEYGNFAGEPVRQSLTEPPPGYRVPSPEQPYGINPDKKPYKPTSNDFNMSSVTKPSQ
jgi:hypothetical protein